MNINSNNYKRDNEYHWSYNMPHCFKCYLIPTAAWVRDILITFYEWKLRQGEMRLIFLGHRSKW